jgi:hypothetical protein
LDETNYNKCWGHIHRLGDVWSIRCTNPVWQTGAEKRKFVTWKRRRDQLDDGGGIVMVPTSLASSTGFRRARVAAQYLGANSM